MVGVDDLQIGCNNKETIRRYELGWYMRPERP